MNLITLSAVIDSESINYVKENGSIKQASARLVTSVNRSDRGVEEEVYVLLYGRNAQTFPTEGNVIVSGQANFAKMNEGERLIINNATIMEGHRSARANTVCIVGRMGRDVELRTFNTESRLAKWSVAVNRTKDMTDWFNVEAWNQNADTAGRYLRKGDNVGITGQLDIQSWEDRVTGESRYKWIVNASRITLISGNKQKEEETVPTSRSRTSTTKKTEEFEYDF